MVNIKRVEEYWDRRPCNVRHSSKPIGTINYFNEVEARRYFVEPHIPRFAQFSRWKGKRVLEIGCGIGTDTIKFAKSGARVTACELSRESLKIAKKRAKVYKLEKRIKFYYVNAEKLSSVVPVKPYDLIYAFGVIHHTPHPEKILAEIKKYTKKDTVIKLMLYNRFSWKTLWIILKFGKGAFWELDKLIAMHSEAATGSPVTYVYSPAEAKRLLAGFKVTKIKIDHIFPYSIPGYINYRYKIVWYFRMLPKSVFRWLKTHFGWHLLIEAQASP